MSDKRQEPRYAFDDEVSLVLTGQAPALAQVMDVSAHGLRLRFQQNLKPQTVLRVRFDFLNPSQAEAVLTIPGEVMHHFPEPGGTSWQIGIRLNFDSPSQEQSFQQALQTLMESL